MRSQDIVYQNAQGHSFLDCLNREPEQPVPTQRILVCFKENMALPTNRIQTTKYTAWNFIPKNLFEQFSKPSNFYFIVSMAPTQIIGILQMLPWVSLTNGVPTFYISLSIITVASAIKDLYEDKKRSVSDTEQNQAVFFKVLSRNGTQIEEIKSQDIRPGMVIKIMRDQQIPVDGLIVSAPTDHVSISTKNLDGQTNLKKKRLLKHFPVLPDEAKAIPSFWIAYETPNDNMRRFQAHVHLDDQEHSQPIDLNYVALRGSRLQVSQYVYVLALNTGHDTKMLRSMNNAPVKKSTIQKKLVRLIIAIMLLMITLAITMNGLKYRFDRHQIIKHEYPPVIAFILGTLSWILNLTNLVPISLIVSLETVKVIQSRILMNDVKMHSNGFKTRVNCSNLLQDLGTVEYIASDKTGTLTKNQLTLRQIYDGQVNITPQWKSMPEELQERLCLCHEAYVVQHRSVETHNESDNELLMAEYTYEYEAESQDEICILNFCSERGCTMIRKTEKSIKLRFFQKYQQIQVLHINKFSSDRKRQSIIYRKDDRTYIVMKGADEEIENRLRVHEPKLQLIQGGVQRLAGRGYRTMMMAHRELQQGEAEIWIKKYKQMVAMGQDINRHMEDIENSMTLDCVIGIEDQLQDEVPHVIKQILEAGIKFVVISGDKRETVRAIAENLHTGQEVHIPQSNVYDPDVHGDKMFLVFARCTPKEKQNIVSKMKGRVLAIGDGANDVAMLTKATIGVGLFGKEGQAAAQAADFAIPQFRHLRRLMFYHGRELYRRNSSLVQYDFYKNFTYAFPQITFAFFSSYTGVSIYESYLSQFFNLLFTSLPIIVFSCCDETQKDESLEFNVKNLYATSKTQVYFSNLRIFFCLLQAMILGIIMSYLCFLLIPLFYRSPYDLNLYEISSILMLYVVIYANLKIVFMQKKINLVIAIVVTGSISMYFIMFKIILSISLVFQKNMEIIFKPKTACVIFICILASMIVSLLFEILLSQIYQTEEEKIEIQQHRQIQQ